MSWRVTAVLALVLALLAGYYAYFELTVFPRREKEAQEAKKIFSFKAEEIKEISLQRGDEEILCIRDNGVWKMLKPVESPGDEAALEKMSAAIAEAKYEKRLEEETPELKAFGLDPPAARLRMTTKDGKVGRELLLGGKSPTGSYAYAALEGEKNIFLLPAGVLDELDKTAFDLRDKRLFTFNPDQVGGLELEARSWRTAVYRVDKKKWAMVVPVDAPAQTKKIDDLLQKLKGWRVKEFISDTAGDLSPYGLDEPAYVVTVKTETEEGRQILMLGKKNDSGNRVFARMKDANSVVMLDAGVLENLPGEVFALRERDFIGIDRERVEKIRLTYPQDAVLLTKKDKDNWIIEGPSALRADRTRVSRLVLDVDDMEVAGFLDFDTPSSEETGLDSPAVRAEFWMEGEKNPIGLELGRKTGDGKGVYARRIRKAGVNVVDSANLDRLTMTAFDLRFKKLLEFDNQDIRAVNLTLDGEEIDILRDGDRWELISPEKRELNSGQVLSFLWALKDLEFREVVSEDGKNVPPGAFEKMQLKVKLVGKNGNSPGALIIGREIPDKKGLAYCRVEDRPLVAAVEPDVVSKARKRWKRRNRRPGIISR